MQKGGEVGGTIKPLHRVLPAGDWQFVHSMDKFLNKYRIPSTRLQTWDYGWNAAYFVTICTRDHVCYFGEVVDGRINALPQLSSGKIQDVPRSLISNKDNHVRRVL